MSRAHTRSPLTLLRDLARGRGRIGGGKYLVEPGDLPDTFKITRRRDDHAFGQGTYQQAKAFLKRPKAAAQKHLKEWHESRDLQADRRRWYGPKEAERRKRADYFQLQQNLAEAE